MIEDRLAKIISKTKADAPAPLSLVSDENRITNIDVNKCIENIHQSRKSYDSNFLINLAESINQQGLLQPIEVTMQEDGNYMINFGHQRVRAFKLLKRQTIPAIIKNITNQKEQVARVLVENLQRQDVNPVDLAFSIRDAIVNEIYSSQGELAEALGYEKTIVSKLLKVLTLPNEILDDISSKKTITDRAVLYILQKVSDVSKCHEAYNYYCTNKPSRDEFKEYVDSLLSISKEKEKTFYTFKTTAKGVTFRTPPMTNEQVEKIEKLLNKFFSESKEVDTPKLS